ncbi:MAG: transcription antitermination factor NusB [Oscillospiraceae bacterium]
MTRREAREQAFVIIFERMFNKETLFEIIENAVEGRSLEIDDFARKLAEQSIIHEDGTNEIIDRLSKKWKINRMPKTTVAILKIALCEIDYFDDIPESVTVNEAVEIAKKYAGAEDASYINGILGAYIKEKTGNNLISE